MVDLVLAVGHEQVGSSSNATLRRRDQTWAKAVRERIERTRREVGRRWLPPRSDGDHGGKPANQTGDERVQMDHVRPQLANQRSALTVALGASPGLGADDGPVMEGHAASERAELGSEDMNIHAPVHLRRCELAKQ